MYMSKGTTSKDTVETRSYGKKLFLWSNSPNFWVAPRVYVYICVSSHICCMKMCNIKFSAAVVPRIMFYFGGAGWIGRSVGRTDRKTPLYILSCVKCQSR